MTRARRPDDPARGVQRGDPWAEYSRRKKQWERDNPNATPGEYGRAMQRIADELGV